jgi:transcriptional regulator with XRE-family HTH domain
MLNNEEFTKRLKKIIDYYGESASSFAEKIGVQRSSISHILSGRNKPSLEFVLKVLSAFPEVELYWLMNGKGKFPVEKNVEAKIERQPTLPNQNKIQTENSNQNLETNSNLFSEEQNLFSKTDSKIEQPQNSEIQKIVNSEKKEIERIVIFYKDGSFSNFQNS